MRRIIQVPDSEVDVKSTQGQGRLVRRGLGVLVLMLAALVLTGGVTASASGS